jgi:hypothetical protein
MKKIKYSSVLLNISTMKVAQATLRFCYTVSFVKHITAFDVEFISISG